ncbi:hypothetical protein T492DRAFT_1056672 [Pavlovales sp. CCMP2436]|nr:hypothetical protein T492DRAFT_1056672 [Pavlovales sp. CCMP2436]
MCALPHCGLEMGPVALSVDLPSGRVLALSGGASSAPGAEASPPARGGRGAGGRLPSNIALLGADGALLASSSSHGEVCALAFAAGGRVAIAVCRSGALRALDALSLEPRATVRLAAGGVCAMSVDPSGEHALVATDARGVLVLTSQKVHQRDMERAMEEMLSAL